MRVRRQRLAHIAASRATDSTADDYSWPGRDEFDAEGDRQDKPPLALPALSHGKTVTLVRHGQSQWNASGRIQGSSNLSLLTDKGRQQADAARQQVPDIAVWLVMLPHMSVDAWCSKGGPALRQLLDRKR